ncbi:NAD-dependent epimerase/dehydratase family protein [Archaeoglobus veneficus]|uniref:NAD-dependent epimerase/dehydratase n=1 Tax=Archaeoglobus veneficus (strain DSM 11195 / SNP6) TaxID=693661 RepID=F2KMK8_ARCVS|nr:NAD-dependent epimerase/dehydratase family protein [Archaeoglobus veneficus]AEA47205.1 NAD-dependent epimerase/dehydratase [Archaeoglobus veneficus SNP6]
MTGLVVRVLLTGATGFLGSYVLSLLTEKYDVVAFVRRPVENLGEGLNVQIIRGDLRSGGDVEKAAKGVDVAVNLAGVLKGDYYGVHVLAAKNLVSNVPRIVHVSALWASPDGNDYQRSKWEGEREVMKAESYTIVRPSVMFGAGDRFVNKILRIMRRYPFIPCFDGRLSPVFVGDVAEIIVDAVERVANGSRETLSLCGPRDFSVEELFQTIADVFGIKKPFVKIPRPIISLYAMIGEITGGDLSRVFLSMLETRPCVRLETDIEDYLVRCRHEFG